MPMRFGSSRRPEAQKKTMKFAICNETFGDWPMERGFEVACAEGYTGIEVAPFTLGLNAREISAAQRREYRQSAESFGLEVIGLHWLLAKTQGYHLTTEDESVRNRTAEYLKELVQLCADLGGHVMVLGSPLQRNFPPAMGHAKAMDNAVSVLKQVVSTLESHDVRIAIEPLSPQEGNFLNHAAQGREMIDKIGSEAVQLHLDVKAMSSEGIPIDKIIRDNSDLLIHFHANDPNLLGPGMGELDQVPVFRALQDIDYLKWVSVEVFNYSPGPETILRTSMQNMLAAIEQAKLS